MRNKQPNNSRRKISGVLTKHEIDEYGLIKQLTESGNCESIDSNKIQATTYDLSVGEAHFVFDENGWEKIYIGNSDERHKLFKADEFDIQNEIKVEELSIAPYGSALIQLDEIVDTYSVYNNYEVMIVGRFDLKLQMVSQGLISQQATQVEPFYKGRLFCYIHNLSNKPHILKFRESFATIEFFYVSSSNDTTQQKELVEILTKQNKEKYAEKIHCLKEGNVYLGIEDIRYFLHFSDDIPDSFGISPILKDGIEDYLNKKYDDMVAIVEKRINLKLKNDNFKLKIINIMLIIILAIINVIAPLLTNYFSRADDSSPKTINEMQNSALEKNVSGDILEDEGTE